MRRRTYKRRDEVLFRDKLPADGQRVFFRRYAAKSYQVGRWVAERRAVLTGPHDAPESEELRLDATHGGVWLYGWSPYPEPKD